MIKKFTYIFILVFLLSCSSEEKKILVKKPGKVYSVEKLYRLAIREYHEGKPESSIKILKQIEKEYSYTTYVTKSVLMIAYIYYEINDYAYSLRYLKNFKTLYPASKYMDYAEFLTALCLYEDINYVSKDQTSTILALDQFKKIINNYPKSKYAYESKFRISLINEQLAGKEMYIARYYINKEKWTPAIFRLQRILELYPKTIFIEEALHRMVEINYRIGNIETAKKYASILGYNFNSSDWYKKTYKIVGDKNYTVINLNRKKGFKDTLLSIFSFSKND